MVGRVWLATAFLCSVVGEDWSRLMWTEGAYGNFSRPFTVQERLGLREQVRGMFTFGWDNYIRHAFPLDELDPIHCVGRGPDYENPENININDVLGDYCLTLVDSLDTLAIMGNRSEFHRAVELAIEYVSFERDNVVQVFEVTIRVLGALLSAHMILTDPQRLLGDFAMPGYDGELLSMAEELAHRLTPAFHASPTGIPYPRVNLASGVPMGARKDTCLAGAGSLLLEFGALSRLVNDTTFEALARRANRALFRAGVELLSGDLDEAICTHALYYAIWRKYEALPERFNWQLLAPDVSFYPLRPELAETTYLLYLSTRNPFYLHVGREIIESIEKHTRVVCGYATMHDVHDKSLEDRMESFFLSETTKYLYLLYDFGNPVNRHYEKLLFTTEGHVFPIDARFRTQEPAEPLFPSSYSNPQPCSEDEDGFVEDDEEASNSDYLWERSEEITTVLKAWNSSSPQPHCDHWPRSRSHGLPLRPKYMAQLAVQLQLP